MSADQGGLRLSFAIKKKNKNSLEPFNKYEKFFKPTLYHVDMNGMIKRYTKIPLKTCSYDDTYEDVTIDGTLLCSGSVESESTDDISVGELRGIPG